MENILHLTEFPLNLLEYLFTDGKGIFSIKIIMVFWK